MKLCLSFKSYKKKPGRFSLAFSNTTSSASTVGSVASIKSSTSSSSDFPMDLEQDRYTKPQIFLNLFTVSLLLILQLPPHPHPLWSVLHLWCPRQGHGLGKYNSSPIYIQLATNPPPLWLENWNQSYVSHPWPWRIIASSPQRCQWATSLHHVIHVLQPRLSQCQHHKFTIFWYFWQT